MTSFLTSELQGRDSYKLLTGLVVPRPIGWVGSRAADGSPNLAPYSFFNAVAGNPPTVVFSPGAAARKDTRDNVLATGEFTLNVVTMDVVEQMNLTAATLEAGESEFDHAGLTILESTVIDAPRVAECRATMECRMIDHVAVGGDTGGTLIIGEVLVFHVEDELLDGTRVDQRELRAVGRHVGNTYSDASHLFDIERPS